MKTKLLILAILLTFTQELIISQKVSKVTPVKIYWLADGKAYDLQKAQSGIPMPQKLELVVVLNANSQLQGQKFEFKWYHRGPTRDYLTNSIVKKVDLKPGENQIILKAGRGNLKRNWWKVQVDAYIDRKPLAYQNKPVFWIKLL